MGCRGICAPAPGVPYPPPSSLALSFAGLFLSHFSYTSPMQLVCCVFLPFLKHVISEVPPTSLMGSFLGSGGWVSFAAGWNWLCPAWWQLLVSPHRGHPCSPLPNKQPCHINPIELYTAKQEETRKKSSCIFLLATWEVLHEDTSGLRSLPLPSSPQADCEGCGSWWREGFCHKKNQRN